MKPTKKNKKKSNEKIENSNSTGDGKEQTEAITSTVSVLKAELEAVDVAIGSFALTFRLSYLFHCILINLLLFSFRHLEISISTGNTNRKLGRFVIESQNREFSERFDNEKS